jgi:hypothetical protein
MIRVVGTASPAERGTSLKTPFMLKSFARLPVLILTFGKLLEDRIAQALASLGVELGSL